MIVNVEIQILGRSLLLSVSMYSDIILEDLFQLCSVCACVSAHGYMHVSEVPVGAERTSDPWSRSWKWLWAVQCVCWALHSGPLEEQQAPQHPPPQHLSSRLTFLHLFTCQPRISESPEEINTYQKYSQHLATCGRFSSCLSFNKMSPWHLVRWALAFHLSVHHLFWTGDAVSTVSTLQVLGMNSGLLLLFI